VERRDDTLTLTLEEITPQQLLEELVKREVTIESFEVASAPLEDIFITVVRERDDA
jgi:ABC-type uncharacterized transport system ATPase subunit